jgi:hypothetical protein
LLTKILQGFDESYEKYFLKQMEEDENGFIDVKIYDINDVS